MTGLGQAQLKPEGIYVTYNAHLGDWMTIFGYDNIPIPDDWRRAYRKFLARYRRDERYWRRRHAVLRRRNRALDSAST